MLEENIFLSPETTPCRISSGADAYKKIKLGASLVQIYTSLVYQGPSLVRKINDELVDLMRIDGVKSLSEIVGTGKVSFK